MQVGAGGPEPLGLVAHPGDETVDPADERVESGRELGHRAFGDRAFPGQISGRDLPQLGAEQREGPALGGRHDRPRISGRAAGRGVAEPDHQHEAARG